MTISKDEGYFLADGGPYVGKVFSDAKEKPFGEIDATCFTCRGKKFLRHGRRCVTCGGEGTVFDQVRIFTAEDLGKRNSAAEKRKEKKRQAEANRQALVSQMFSDFIAERKEFFDALAGLPANKYISDVFEKARHYGSFTEGQMQTFESMVNRHRSSMTVFAHSSAFAVADEQIERSVTCISCRSFQREKFHGGGMETVYFTEMIDDDGNAVVTSTPVFQLEPGQKVVLTGTVKDIDASQGWTRTIVIRPKGLPLGYGMEALSATP